MIFLQGMNDIGGGTTAAQITAAMQQIIDRVHARGLSIVGGTPFPAGKAGPRRMDNEDGGARLAVNSWIRAEASSTE